MTSGDDARGVDARPVIRRAMAQDSPALGRLGGLLLKAHYDFDSRRFMAPGEDSEGGYAWFLERQINEDTVVVFVAEHLGDVVGYVYAGIEPQSWKELREEAGFIHDVVVDPHHRRMGLATALMDAALAWFRERNMPRVLLWTAEPNHDAQRVFTRLGFRRTMVEMTREL